MAIIVFSMIACNGDKDDNDNYGIVFQNDLGFKPDDERIGYLVGGFDDKGNMLSHINVTIPASINGRPVTGILENAFANCTTLISVSIPDSVKFIGDYAFYKCTNLATVNIPESVTNIGAHVFNGTKISNPNILHNKVTSIGIQAFAACASLISVIIPSSVIEIDFNAFSHDNLTSVTFQSTISNENFDSQAFPGDLKTKYFAGGVGTYTRLNGSNTWTKQP
jgi:hypothetical protein